MKNLIICFSGTGNNLYLAKELQKKLDDCHVILLDINTQIQINETYERIGFIYPTYFWGIPKLLKEKISNIDFSKSQTSYFFAVASYGGSAGGAIEQVNEILKSKNIKLNYGEKIKMFSNYIIMYKMSKNISKITEKSDKEKNKLFNEIISKKYKPVKKINPIYNKYYKVRLKKLPFLSKNFNVNSSCTSCGICKKLCPTGNIVMKEGNPSFGVKCEQCMSCIQLCPESAINYKNKTQNRGRYKNPSIKANELFKK